MKNAEQPAFPVGENTPDSGSGLNKREYFAAMALGGICTSGHYQDANEAVQTAIRFADELLKQLES